MTNGRKLRILLIDSPYTNIIKGACPPGEPILAESNHPIGLLYTGTYVQKKLKEEIDLKILGFKPSEKNYIRITHEVVRDFKPDIVGITTYTFTLYDAYQIAKAVKTENPKIKLVAGGVNTSIYPEEMIKQEFIDAIFMGDGEEIFAEFIKNFNTQDMYSVNGTWIKKDKEIIKNHPAPPILDLDKIPFPDRNLIINKEIYQESYIFPGYRKTELVSSRGCPYSCSYCQSSGKKYRVRSPKNVVDEMEYLLGEGYNFFQFWDDTFNIQIKRVKEICKEIIRRNLQKKIRYRIRIVANIADEEMFRLLKESGCEMVYIGVESGDDQILESVNRKIKVEHCKEAIRLAKKYGLSVMGYFMIGFPGETKNHIKKTLDFMLKNPFDFMETTILVPMPTTPIYKRAIEEGKMDDWYRRYTLSPWKNAWYKYYETTIKAEELYKIQKQIYFRFYFRPSYIIRLALKSRDKNSFMKRFNIGIRLLRWIFSQDYPKNKLECELNESGDYSEIHTHNGISSNDSSVSSNREQVFTYQKNSAEDFRKQESRPQIKLSVKFPLKLLKFFL